MPRTLPWLVGVNEKKPTPSTSTPRTVKHEPSVSPAEPAIVNPNGPGGINTPTRHRERQDARSPSTSPPPAPPEAEYMNEGYQEDDIWMMVEDEFYSTAQIFTKHIHHAEYLRLKRLAKARGQQTLSHLGRGTDGVIAMSAELRMRREAQDLLTRQKTGLETLAGAPEDDSDSDEANDFALDPQLAKMMTIGKQNAVQDLSKFALPKSDTRAAAGLSRSPQKSMKTKDVFAGEREATSRKRVAEDYVEDDEQDDNTDDDLDVKPIRSAASHYASKHHSGFPLQGHREVKTPSTPEPAKESVPHAQRPLTSSLGLNRAFISTLDTAGTSDKRGNVREPVSSFPQPLPTSRTPLTEADVPDKGGKGSKAAEYMRKRRAERERHEEEEKRKVRDRVVNDIPTFMF